MKKIARIAILAGFAGLMGSTSCQETPAKSSVPPKISDSKPFTPIADQEHLHNAHFVTKKVISGAQPEGDESFEALRKLGVVTIISVDGAMPDVETAKRFGMRYVHLPITYSTVTEEEGREIAKAIDELPGPIYVHCHHGKHRSAAAVAVACVYNGSLPTEQAEDILKTFGTGENYIGLWKAAREARPLDAETLESTKVQYLEKVKIPPLAETMVLIDQRTDHLKVIQKSGWQTPTNHPDLDPPHEALQLQEHLKELARTEVVQSKPEKFRQMLLESEARTDALRLILEMKPMNAQSADAAFAKVTTQCAACHKAYRD